MIITNNNLQNKKTKIDNALLKASAKSMLGNTHNPLELYSISGITDKIRGSQESYVLHLVPKSKNKTTDKYIEYILSILKPNTTSILERFVAQLSVHIDVAKAFEYDLKKLNESLRNGLALEYKNAQFVLTLDKAFIKKLHLLCPLSTSQEYILSSFNLALHQTLKR